MRREKRKTFTFFRYGSVILHEGEALAGVSAFVFIQDHFNFPLISSLLSIQIWSYFFLFPREHKDLSYITQPEEIYFL